MSKTYHVTVIRRFLELIGARVCDAASQEIRAEKNGSWQPTLRAGGAAASLAVSLCFLSGCTAPEESANSCCEKDDTVVGASEPVSEASTPKEGSSVDQILASPWREPSERSALHLDHQLTRHDGVAMKLSDLVGQPLAISFAYTRCMNPNKCRAVTTTMGGLRRDLEEAGLLKKVRLVLITYDALYDAPKVMRDYAQRNQLELDDRALFLRPAFDSDHRLFRDLGARASFNKTGVAIHGIQLLLVDKAGRLARTYRTLIWDNEQVAKDLDRLARE